MLNNYYRCKLLEQKHYSNRQFIIKNLKNMPKIEYTLFINTFHIFFWRYMHNIFKHAAKIRRGVIAAQNSSFSYIMPAAA